MTFIYTVVVGTIYEPVVTTRKRTVKRVDVRQKRQGYPRVPLPARKQVMPREKVFPDYTQCN